MVSGPANPPPASNRLAFLDGTRGWAALVVVVYHIFCSGLALNPFFRDELSNWAPFNGNLAVAVFFALSGFALSLRFVTDGDRIALGRMAIGRYPRLAIPIAAACAIVLIGQYLNVILPVEARPQPFRTMLTLGPDPIHFIRFVTFDVFFNYRAADTYIGPLWTMSYELAGSFIVVGLLMALGSWRFRPAAIGVAMAILIVSGHYYLSLFVAGMLLAELWTRTNGAGNSPVALGLLTIAVAAPVLTRSSIPGVAIGGAAVLAAVLLSPHAQRVLSSPLSRWLGRISFPLYLVHGPVMWMVGLHIVPQDESLLAILARLVLVALSLAAAAAFTPINDFAIAVSHRLGRLILPPGGAILKPASPEP